MGLDKYLSDKVKSNAVIKQELAKNESQKAL